ncbi:siderophore-interacting protein [Luteococcus japonicus]|uniref:Iron utilization protein n=1 Tax=Luteococcus japonicus LSP_Lj1 TaxID=1255658 RepID=A0A1R4KJR3_9ACTN|nr:siderophore-interacting protein [Luteococcus japonicus]SJN44254.1 Iron utilization protein [Luteococcus japonicus LSP_Lj1]
MNAPRQPRPARHATVTGKELLTRDMVRVHFEGADLRQIGPLEKTDSYVKLLFPPSGAGYTLPFDPDRVQDEHPREQWPVSRTYTVRHHDLDAGRMSIDFLVHGDAGIAGPWAMRAEPGESVVFRGPGGGWAPRPDAPHHLLVGDETALPAIGAALDDLPHGASATAVLQVADASVHLPLRSLPGLDVIWLHRDEQPGAEPVLAAVERLELPWDGLEAFVHGSADMVRLLRRHLLGERAMPREHLSLSGYWRPGLDEDHWQASKQDFAAQMEQETTSGA